MGNASRLTKSVEPSADAASMETVLTFKYGWEQAQKGEMVAGGRVTINYSIDRLPFLRHEHQPNWGIEAFVMFRPANVIRRGSVKDSSFSFKIPHGTLRISSPSQSTSTPR